MSISTAQSVRCPRCSATLRAGTEWCSQCFADLRPPAERDAPAAAVEAVDPAEISLDTALPASPAVDVPSDPVAALSGGRHGKHARSAELGAVTAPAPDEVDRLAAQLVAQLAATEGGNPLGSVSGLVDTAGKRVGLMVGGGLAAMLLIFAVMFLVGALL